jgi:hypothetical protein
MLIALLALLVTGLLAQDNAEGRYHTVGRVLSFFSMVVGIWTPPTPHPQAFVPSTLLVPGEGVSLAWVREGGRLPIPTKGHSCTLWSSTYVRTLW